MKPLVLNKEIRKAKYKHSWYKSFVRLLRNQRQKDFRNNSTINLS